MRRREARRRQAALSMCPGGSGELSSSTRGPGVGLESEISLFQACFLPQFPRCEVEKGKRSQALPSQGGPGPASGERAPRRSRSGAWCGARGAGRGRQRWVPGRVRTRTREGVTAPTGVCPRPAPRPRVTFLAASCLGSPRPARSPTPSPGTPAACPAPPRPRAPWRPPPALPPPAVTHRPPPSRLARPLTCGGRPAGRGRGGAGRQQQGEPPGQPIPAGPAPSGRAGGAGGGSGRRAPGLPPAPPRPRRPLLPPALLPSLLPRSNPHLPPAPAPRPPRSLLSPPSANPAHKELGGRRSAEALGDGKSLRDFGEGGHGGHEPDRRRRTGGHRSRRYWRQDGELPWPLADRPLHRSDPEVWTHPRGLARRG